MEESDYELEDVHLQHKAITWVNLVTMGTNILVPTPVSSGVNHITKITAGDAHDQRIGRSIFTEKLHLKWQCDLASSTIAQSTADDVPFYLAIIRDKRHSPSSSLLENWAVGFQPLGLIREELLNGGRYEVLWEHHEVIRRTENTVVEAEFEVFFPRARRIVHGEVHIPLGNWIRYGIATHGDIDNMPTGGALYLIAVTETGIIQLQTACKLTWHDRLK